MNAELSLGPFCNWFLPSCSDIWSGKRPSINNDIIIFVYGARSSLCITNILDSDKSVKLIDCIKIFDNKSLITGTKFAKNSLVPYLFISSSEGDVGVIDCFSNELIIQNNYYGRRKIFAVDWLDNVNVYYAIDELIINWNISNGTTNHIKIPDYYDNKISITTLACNNKGNKLAIGYMNGDIMVLNFDNPKSTTSYKCLKYSSGHTDDICSLSFSWTNGFYSEGILVSTSRDGFVRVWDISNQKQLIYDYKIDSTNKQKIKNWFASVILPQTRQNNHSRKNNNEQDYFEVLVSTGNGQLLVFDIPTKPQSGRVRVFNTQNFDRSFDRSFDRNFDRNSDQNKKLTHTSVIFNIAIDHKNMIASTLSLDHQIIIWDLVKRKAMSVFQTFMYGAHGITFSHIDPSLFAVALGDGIRLFNLTRDLRLTSFTSIPIQSSKSKSVRVTGLAWQPELENRICYSKSDGQVTVVDIKQSGTNTKYTTKNTDYDTTKIYTITWGPGFNSHDKWAVYVVHQSGRIYVHFPSENKYNVFEEFIKGMLPKKRSELSWRSDHTLLAVGNEDGTVDIFQYSDKRINFVLSIKSLSRCIFSLVWNSHQNNTYSHSLAICSDDTTVGVVFLADHIKRIQDLSGERVVTRLDVTLTGHKDKITYLSWSYYQANKLASASYDQTVRIWDVETGSNLIVYKGHRSVLYFVEWSSQDSDLLFSGGEDNIINIWRPSKQPINNNYNNHNNHNNHNNNNNHDNQTINGDDSDQCLQNNLRDNTFIDYIVNQVVQDCIDKVVKSIDNHVPLKSMTRSIQVNEYKKDSKFNVKINKSSSSSTNDQQVKGSKKSKEKKVSLFPLSNSIDNSSTKSQKLEDIEYLKAKVSGMSVSYDRSDRSDINDKICNGQVNDKICNGQVNDNISGMTVAYDRSDRNDRICCYGGVDDVNNMIDREIDHHTRHGNITQKNILGFFKDIKSTIIDAMNNNELTPDIVALAGSVSKQLWRQTCLTYARQLESTGHVEMSVCYLLGLSLTRQAIDVLTRHNLYREAIVIAKTKLESPELINHLVMSWANLRECSGDYEGAAKCYTSLGEFQLAHNVLARRSELAKSQHTADVLAPRSDQHSSNTTPSLHKTH